MNMKRICRDAAAVLLCGLMAGASVCAAEPPVCTQETVQDCMKMGTAAYSAGQYDKARALWGTACGFGLGKGCRLAGMLTLRKDGKAAWKDILDWFSRGAVLNDGYSCRFLGEVYEAGYLSEHVPVDPKRSISFYHDGCRHGDDLSCLRYWEAKGEADELVAGRLEDAVGRLKPEEVERYADLLQKNGASPGRMQEIFARGCAARSGAACRMLGLAWADQDSAKALQAFRKGCALKNVDACLDAADAVRASRQELSGESLEDVIALEGRACELDAGACWSLHVTKVQAGRDVQESIAALEAACGENDFMACSRLGMLYGDGVGLERNMSKCLQFQKKACELDETACGQYAAFQLQEAKPFEEFPGHAAFQEALSKADERLRNQATLFFQDFLSVDDLHALTAPELEKRLCRLDPLRCTGVKTFLESWRKSHEEPLANLARACHAGHPWSCLAAGTVSRANGTRWQAGSTDLSYFQTACDLGEAKGCQFLAVCLKKTGAVTDEQCRLSIKACEMGYGPGCLDAGYCYSKREPTRENLKMAELYSLKGCRLGEAVACGNLGRLYLDGKSPMHDEEMAEKYLRMACHGERGDGAACVALAGLLFERDSSRGPEAIELMERACGRLEDPTACMGLAISYELGRFGVIDEEKAFRFHDRACGLGDDLSCRRLMLRFGSAVGKDARKWHKYSSLLCGRGSDGACYDEAKALLELGRTAEGLLKLKELCPENSNACYRLAKLNLELPAPWGSRQEGLRLLESLHEKGDLTATSLLTLVHGTDDWGLRDSKRACALADILLQKTKDPVLLLSAGTALMNCGESKRGVALEKRLCDEGQAVACRELEARRGRQAGGSARSKYAEAAGLNQEDAMRDSAPITGERHDGR